MWPQRPVPRVCLSLSTLPSNCFKLSVNYYNMNLIKFVEKCWSCTKLIGGVGCPKAFSRTDPEFFVMMLQNFNIDPHFCGSKEPKYSKSIFLYKWFEMNFLFRFCPRGGNQIQFRRFKTFKHYSGNSSLSNLESGLGL